MYRYRINPFYIDFDSRSNILQFKEEDFSDNVFKTQYINTQNIIRTQIINKYGSPQERLKRYIELGKIKPSSIIGHHNKLLEEICDSYIIGADYPALVSACTFGERLLNHLILNLRENYKGVVPKEESLCKNMKVYSKIFTSQNCSNWKIMINTLSEWGVFYHPEIKDNYLKLKKIRDTYIHFNKIENHQEITEKARESITYINNIVDKLFGIHFKDSFCFITGVGGELYLKKELEESPFFKKYYMQEPIMTKVSPYHQMSSSSYDFIENSENKVTVKEITDDEFVVLRNNYLSQK